MTTTELEATTATEIEQIDVLIVGAGISGLGSAHHLREQCPDRSFVILEAMDHFGGTWYTHRYPGVRSDSDLFTFGYRFKPWRSAPIASGEEIQTYLQEFINEEGLDEHIRYQHRVISASWSSDELRWHVVARDESAKIERHFSAGFFWMCSGYYRHSEGYTPEWPGFDRFQGRVVHPQQWPADLDLSGQQVLVIGSGATAATLVPAIADTVGHVTLLQRSPTFFFIAENRNEVSDTLRSLGMNDAWIHTICRTKIIHDQGVLTKFSVEQPEFVREMLLELVKQYLPEGYDVDTHFNPSYRPWQQRIAFIPEGDLFKGIASGKASVVTDQIDHFDEKGVVLTSGQRIDADVIITATGFNLLLTGDIEFSIDGAPIDFSDTITYRGMMFTGVPNLAHIFGYFRASWTLRADIVGDFVCRLLNHMEDIGATVVTPQLRAEDVGENILSWIDPENFNPGYIMRSMDQLPRRLDKPEWQHTQDYLAEREALPVADLDDGCLIYS